ncbi:MAG TPA: hypothetical protein VF624_00820 [Tepidisphaeraceae bacterium]|jgi:hypothetical protein
MTAFLKFPMFLQSLTCLAVLLGVAQAATARTLSHIDLGDEASERAANAEFRHAAAVRQDYTSGGENAAEAGRRIVPAAGEGPGWIAFDAVVLPEEQNYLTLRVWGGEKTWGPLHLREVGADLDLGNVWAFNSPEPPAPGRWVYRTFPIPREVTRGKSRLRLRLQNVPAPAGAGFRNADTPPPPKAYRPTFAVYALYAHVDPYFTPPPGEKQGEPFAWGPPRAKPADYPSIEARLKERALADIDYATKYDVLRSEYGEGVHRRVTRTMHALAVIYHTEWSGHYKDEALLTRVRDAIDIQVQRMARQGGDPGTMYYRGWISFGNVAAAYAALHDEFAQRRWLDEPLALDTPAGPRTPSRRKAYGDFFHDAFEWRRGDRRHYTNQPVHISWTLYNTQTALRLLGDRRALTEPQALWYVHEAVGLVPHRSQEFGIDADAAGFAYPVMTDKGLTRELGYVDAYGELTGDMVKLARLTNDPKVTAKAVQFVDTRSIFRVPTNDVDGHAALRGIGFMSWRSPNHPFRIGYNGIVEAAALGSPAALRLAQLEIEHGRLFLLAPVPERGAHWNALDAIHLYADYLHVKDLPPTPHRLPMEPGHGDFAFGDEEIGAFAFRHGDTRVYGSFYANFPPSGEAVNDRGIVCLDTPTVQRLVDAHSQTQTPPSGLFMDVKFPWGSRRYEQAPPPPGFARWQDNPPNAFDRRAGLAHFYQMRFGDYVIAMNTTESDSYRRGAYRLELPAGTKRAVDVQTGRPVDPAAAIEIGPRTTRVIYLGDQ